MLILCAISIVLSCIFSFVCYGALYILIFTGIVWFMVFMIETFGGVGAFFILEELVILIPMLIGCLDLKDDEEEDKDEVKEIEENK